MIHVVFDLEATCWGRHKNLSEMETIEIGAVRLDPESYEITDTFSTFVKPDQNPGLSDFCRELTSIRQSDVDSAPGFPGALERFLIWAGGNKVTYCSWGTYDIKQLRKDISSNSVELRDPLRKHISLKQLFAHLYERKPCSMKKALNILGLELEGIHHRGIDDARNIAKIARIILPEYYRQRKKRRRKPEFEKIVLFRGPCLGSCPVYQVAIHGDGRVIYHGTHFVEKKGHHSWQLDQKAVQSLKRAVYRFRYFEMEPSEYPMVMTCVSSSFTSVLLMDGTYRGISNSKQGYTYPDRLDRFENRIDEIIGVERYVGHTF
ncbi:MAG: exonuclease domain-containing protein [Candidatus Krumholzibacteriota bacterium]